MSVQTTAPLRPTAAVLDSPAAPRVLALSARDAVALAEGCRRLADRLEQQPALAPDDVAATLQRGRERFAVRCAAVGRDTAELARALRAEAGRIDRAAPADALEVPCDDPFDESASDGPAAYAHRIARQWADGLDVDTTLGRPGRRVRLPGYAFRRDVAGSLAPEAAQGQRPLTPHEQRWLFHDLVRSSGSADHNVTAVASLPAGPGTPGSVAEGFAALQRLHPELRTVFAERGGRWSARTEPSPVVLTRAAGVHPDPAAAARDLAGRSFELRGGPLARCVLAEGPDGLAVALTLYEPIAGPGAEALLADLLQLANLPAHTAI
ncbi:CurL C-terminal domain-containing protein [Kitasatospora sp. McL0602]|uniref:CurL C-terminal domain-containing protein n=1 Tax=Kitasatospora sp. McL0602 TaxID=3439530 RepID=UPI003F8BE9CF